MDPTARFGQLVVEATPDLDELALLVAAHARPGLDLDAERRRLDDLAERFRIDGGGDGESLRRWLEREGFGPNETDYHDPDNSLLDQVLRRRTGIPITLCVVLLEVGRRCGLDLAGVSLPGEFLVREAQPDAPGGVRFHNPFRRAALSPTEVVDLFTALHGPGPRFHPSMLDGVGPVDIVARMLANLVGIAARRQDLELATWTLRLRTLLPGSPPAEQRQLAGVLEGRGRFWEAADVLEHLAERDAAGAERHRADAARLRSALN